jgi:hypothetical protein
MPRCILLGAGATHGYDDSLVGSAIPPQTVGLFASPHARELLGQSRYESLREAWKAQLSANGADAETVDVELFFQELTERLDLLQDRTRWSNLDTETRRVLLDTHEAVGALWWFLFELFQPFLREMKSGPNNYSLLARDVQAHPSVLISLNYDPLLEASILREQLPYSYTPPPVDQTIPILKVHGSVTWLNEARGISMRMHSREKTVKAVVRMAYQNRIQPRPVRVLSIPEYLKMGFDEVLRDGNDYDIPALLPPIGNHKDYEQLDVYRNLWEAAGTSLSEATELILIGTRLRESDVKLCSTLTRFVRRHTPITIVGDYRAVKARLDQMLGWTHDSELPFYRRFGDWVRSLEEPQS